MSRKWLQTWTGKRFDYHDIDPQEQICIEDIAHALARLTRYVGQGNFFSVAQHSVLALDFSEFDQLARKLVLFHDAHEAYTGDIPSPVKAMLAGDGIHVIEDHIQEAIHTRFGLPWPVPERYVSVIKVADLKARDCEVKVVFNGERLDGWDECTIDTGCQVKKCKRPEDAEADFLVEYRRLWRG